jgi:hypothetical protein
MTDEKQDEFAEVSRLIKTALANFPWKAKKQPEPDAEIYDRIDQDSEKLEF